MFTFFFFIIHKESLKAVKKKLLILILLVKVRENVKSLLRPKRCGLELKLIASLLFTNST